MTDNPAMAALVLGIIALATIVSSFAFAALVLALSRPPADPHQDPTAASADLHRDHETATETMSRVLADVERLAALRERGALTEKEFTAQKAKLLGNDQSSDRTPLASRAR